MFFSGLLEVRVDVIKICVNHLHACHGFPYTWELSCLGNKDFSLSFLYFSCFKPDPAIWLAIKLREPRIKRRHFSPKLTPPWLSLILAVVDYPSLQELTKKKLNFCVPYWPLCDPLWFVTPSLCVDSLWLWPPWTTWKTKTLPPARLTRPSGIPVITPIPAQLCSPVPSAWPCL